MAKEIAIWQKAALTLEEVTSFMGISVNNDRILQSCM